MPRLRLVAILFLVVLAISSARAEETSARWSVERANAWQQQTGWLVGCNYTPATAINQLEMWQADTFDPAQIDKELAWAESLGFNSIRVFLHDLLWEQDAEGLLRRMDEFLAIAQRHNIGVMFVFFDSCWNATPKLGRQPEPRPGVHNSGWVQSPAAADLFRAERLPFLEAYVKGVIGRFKNDRRVQVWDLWNEPGNTIGANYSKEDVAKRHEAIKGLMPQVFAWARSVAPSQPLTSGMFVVPKRESKTADGIAWVQFQESDVLSFHCYQSPEALKWWVEGLQKEGRPILCTEYMMRTTCPLDPILGYFHEQKIGAYNWGLVSGKTNTIYPWSTCNKPATDEPKVWLHDLLRADGTPFDLAEAAYIRGLTGKAEKP